MALSSCGIEYWKGATFTHTMADSRISAWERILEPYRGKVHRVLEVGSYEGQSALFWQNFFHAEVWCIDNWQNPASPLRHGHEVEANFDANTRLQSIFKIKDESTIALHCLRQQKIHQPFDLIYIDGDHSPDQVMIDSCLAWRMLTSGGIMIWDDWRDYIPHGPEDIRPEWGIECFLRLKSSRLEILADTGQQLMVEKLRQGYF